MPGPFTEQLRALEYRAKESSRPLMTRDSKLGAGSFSTVRKSRMPGLVVSSLHETASIADHKNLMNSYKILQSKEVSSQFIHFDIARFEERERITSRIGPEEKDNLSKYCRRLTKPLDYDTLISLIAQLVAGLTALHTKGLTHRDFKSANVLINILENGLLHIKINDFDSLASVDEKGIAKEKGIEYRTVTVDYRASELVHPEDRETHRRHYYSGRVADVRTFPEFRWADNLHTLNLFAIDIFGLGVVVKELAEFTSLTVQQQEDINTLVTQLTAENPATRPAITVLHTHPLLSTAFSMLDSLFPFKEVGKFELRGSPASNVVNLLLPPKINEAYEDLKSLNNLMALFAEEKTLSPSTQQRRLAMQMWRARLSLNEVLNTNAYPFRPELEALDDILTEELMKLSAQISDRLVNKEKMHVKRTSFTSFGELLSLYYHQANIKKMNEGTIKQFFTKIYLGLKPAYREQALLFFLNHPHIGKKEKKLACSLIAETMYCYLHFHATREDINLFSEKEMIIYLTYLNPKYYALMSSTAKRTFHHFIKQHQAYKDDAAVWDSDNIASAFATMFIKAWRGQFILGKYKKEPEEGISYYFTPESPKAPTVPVRYDLPAWDGDPKPRKSSSTATAIEALHEVKSEAKTEAKTEAVPAATPSAPLIATTTAPRNEADTEIKREAKAELKATALAIPAHTSDYGNTRYGI